MRLSKEHVKHKSWAKHGTFQTTNIAVISHYNTTTLNYIFATLTMTKHNARNTTNALIVLTDYTEKLIRKSN